MDQEREEQLYQMQADLCQALADPTRLKLLTLLGEKPRAVKDLSRQRVSARQRSASTCQSCGSVALYIPNEWEQKCITPLQTRESWKLATSHAKYYSRD